MSGPAAAAPLTDLLTVTDVDGLAGEITKALQQVLATISVDARQLDGLGATVVTTSGEFRIGALRGHHHKAAAEHIGLSARQAVLERQRAEADDELALAQSQLDVIGQRRTGAAGHVSDATTLRTDLPPIRDIVAAVGRSELAEEALGAARVRHDERQRARLTAEQAHADASDELQRIAATVGLPVDADALDDIRRTLDRLPNLADAASRAATSLTKAVGRWIDRGHDVQRARHDLETSETHLASVRDEHRQLQSRLATLEDSLGADYDQIVADIETSRVDLADARRRLALAHDGVGDAREAHARASEQHAAAVAARETADAQCIAALPHLHAVVEVPGLLVASHYTAEHADAPPPLPAVEQSADGLRHLARALLDAVPAPTPPGTTADGVRQSLRRRRDTLGAGWDVEDQQPDAEVPLRIEVTGPSGRSPLPQATEQVDARLRQMTSLLSAKQDQALRNLLQGLVAREVAEKLHAATELIARMNRRLTTITTSHGIGVSLRWRRRDDLDPHLAGTIDLLAKAPDLRTPDEDATLIAALSERIATARLDDPEQPYRELIAGVLDYRMWHEMSLVLRRPGRNDEKLTRRTALSEGEKKMVSYLPLFAAVAASCDALAERTPSAPRFLLLDDAFAKVSEDNHAKLFGLLVDLDLDFIATSERLWGTHSTVPELAITEVIRDADLGAIVLEHSHWDGQVTVSA
ncbi:MAG: hypothetical protein JJE52_04940 [Acidimicrobiia bacterium]|nr:hypothetical protein [Acidimicrobiia bacterium]